MAKIICAGYENGYEETLYEGSTEDCQSKFSALVQEIFDKTCEFPDHEYLVQYEDEILHVCCGEPMYRYYIV